MDASKARMGARKPHQLRLRASIQASPKGRHPPTPPTPAGRTDADRNAAARQAGGDSRSHVDVVLVRFPLGAPHRNLHRVEVEEGRRLLRGVQHAVGGGHDHAGLNQGAAALMSSAQSNGGGVREHAVRGRLPVGDTAAVARQDGRSSGGGGGRGSIGANGMGRCRCRPEDQIKSAVGSGR